MATATAPTVAPEIVTPIRPSEALRLGRLTYPNPLRHNGIDEETRSACAIGAMYQGYGFWDSLGGPNPLYGLTSACPEIDSDHPDLWPYYGEATHPLEDTVMHLNDDHGWSDAQMVAWLEGLEL